MCPSVLTLTLVPMRVPTNRLRDGASDGPERDALELLEATWISDDGSIVIPVDPFEIAQRLGIKVFTAELGDGVSGMLTKQGGYDDPQVYLNAADSRNRQRFTCGHELGHYVRRSSTDATDESWEYVDRRASLASAGTNPDEIYANQFAASLLMPRRIVTELHKRFGPAALASEFGVSSDAMSFRLRNLGLQ
jgi:Zn-dependent peptidase ImmA (M78 family)